MVSRIETKVGIRDKSPGQSRARKGAVQSGSDRIPMAAPRP